MNIKVNLVVKTCLRNEKKEYNIKGIYNDFKIKFKEIDSNNLMIIDLNNKVINRIKDQEEICFDFNNEICTVISNNLKFDLEIKVLEIKVTKNYFLVKYKIASDNFKIEIKII